MDSSLGFNDALKRVNSFGLYQKMLCAFLVIPSAGLSALIYLCQFMILLVPDKHWCQVPQLNDLNLTTDEWMLQTIPMSDEEKYSKCQMYSSVNSTSWSAFEKENRTVVGCQNGWNYDFSQLYPTIATELNWVCEDDKLPYWTQTIYYVGTSIGSLIFGFIADRYGRRPSIVLSYLITCVAGTASAFTDSFTTFSLLRFLVGACIIPVAEDPYVLSLEYIGEERRTLATVFWSLGYIVFSCIFPWIAYGLGDWRKLTLFCSVPLAVVVIGCKWIPESACWLLMQGRDKEAIAQLQKVARVNGKTLAPDVVLEVEGKEIDEEAKKTSFLTLFRMPRLRKHSLILAVSWFITYCCYHTNVQNTSNLSSDIYESFTFGALVEAPVLLFILLGIDRFGRKAPMVVALALATLAGVLLPAVPKDKENWFLIVGLVQRLGITANYNIVMQYSAEIFPTVLRGRGLSFLRFMGTVGLYFSPSIVYLGLGNAALPLLTCGAMALVLGLLTLLLPETLHRPMPHSVQEGENFGRNQTFCSPCPPWARPTQARPKMELADEPLPTEPL